MFLILKFSISFFYVNLFARESVSGGGTEREGEREFQAGSRLSAQSPTLGLSPQTMRSWPEQKSRVRHLINWAMQMPWFSVSINALPSFCHPHFNSPGIIFDSSSPLHLLAVKFYSIILLKLSVPPHLSINFIKTKFLLKYSLKFLNCVSTFESVLFMDTNSVILKFRFVHPIYTLTKLQWFPSICQQLINFLAVFQIITYSSQRPSIPIYDYFRLLYAKQTEFLTLPLLSCLRF